MCHPCTRFKLLIKELLTKYKIFKKLPQISHTHKNCDFFKQAYNWNFFDQLLLPYKFYGSGMRGILFFNFASCELLNGQLKWCPSNYTILKRRKQLVRPSQNPPSSPSMVTVCLAMVTVPYLALVTPKYQSFPKALFALRITMI